MYLNPVIFGSTGMIGQGVLLECFDDDRVKSVLTINRRSSGISHPKLTEITHQDFYNISSLTESLRNCDCCFYSLGVSAVGLSESEYHKLTYELTVHIAEVALKANPEMVFCYISGAGTDSTEKGRQMWARVKGKLENKLLAMPFKKAYMFRPGYIQPMKGIRSRTKWYNIVYSIFKPLYFLLRPIKKAVTDTTTLGRAMIEVVATGYDKNILGNADINAICKKQQ